MAKTLYVTDLDGTLMKDDKSISETSVTILNNLIKHGLLVTYATARSINSASAVTKDIDFQLPVIIRNGTIFADPQTQEEIEIAMFTQENLQSVRQCTQGLTLFGFATSYIDGKEQKSYLKGMLNEGFQQYLVDHADDGRLRAVLTEDELYEGEVCYFTFIGEREELEPLYSRVKDSDEWICVFQQDKYRPEYWLEICPKDATKAKAIRKLQKQYNCERVVVFGDSLNDISMFQAADEAYAVGNAMESLKEIATGIIGDNNSDGVARWLAENISSQKAGISEI
ncbi:MAG: Cof-type HAD-IIB family hydrolase [Lachnospiraceae bacterium]|nr:Cof-type HAD-IIB family hydrolase [Lachnospiraceae bacterium]